MARPLKYPLAFGLLLLASIQAAFLAPYFILVPGERVNLFTPLLTLLPALVAAFGSPRATGQRSCLPWAALGIGLGVAALSSEVPAPSLLRAFAFYAPAVSGLICAWLLFRGGEGLELFFNCLTACFAVLTGAHFVFGTDTPLFGLHHHALAGMLLLLAAGPLRLCHTRRGPVRWAAVLLLCLGYGLCLSVGSRYLALLPLALIPLLWGLGILRPKAALAGTLGAVLVGAMFFYSFPAKIPRMSGYESTFYRLEGIPASLELVRQHPLLGIGIRAPRAHMLLQYEPVFGMADKQTFLEVVQRNITADNQYLSLLVDIGLPLGLLYFVLIWQLLRGYLITALHDKAQESTGMVLLIPLTASLIHFLIYDGLYYPQISWFFHLLLGIGAWHSSGAENRAHPDNGAGQRDSVAL